MAKERITLGDDDAFLPVTLPGNGNKFPVDIQRGRVVNSDYLDVPPNQLIPYGDKLDSDFARHNKALSEATIRSMKEDGVIEAISVRAKEDGMFEILSGESRWRHATAAGLERITIHVIANCDDNKARRIFSVTNLLRRDMSCRDKINGWWHYYRQVKDAGQLNELRNSVNDVDVVQSISKDDESISFRQIMRYVKMHDLISEWIDELDNDTVTQRVAEQIANFTTDIQRKLLHYKISEEQVKELRRIADGAVEGKTLNDETIAELLGKKVAVREKLSKKATEKAPVSEQVRVFNKAKKGILHTTQTLLREKDYARADEVIAAALKLYYEQNP